MPNRDTTTPSKNLNDTWLTPKLLAQAEPSFTEAAIRNQVFNAAPRKSSKGTIPGNGLAQHIRRVGSKVLINHGGYLSWIANRSLLVLTLVFLFIFIA